ncbi:MAG: hypothetical protein M1825_001618 [Sarcosagium campestre]|nr:MAG: hypothetical protein M1825_001618 [Sarcosagium campestre]
MASHGVPRTAATSAPTVQEQEKQLQKISDYRKLVGEVQTKISAREYNTATLSLTSKLLTLNPEYYTIWNARRLIFLHGLFPSSSTSITTREEPPSPVPVDRPGPLALLEADLRFLLPLLREYPKCYWIWNHRLWLLHQSSQLLPVNEAQRIWRDELGLVGKMLSRDGRNFHGWGYRRTVVAELERLARSIPAVEAGEAARVEPAGISSPTSLVESEFAYTTKMISSNLSNFSAWHRRSQLIPRLLEERGADIAARWTFFNAEVEQIHNALYTDPYDQSLWFYHRYLFSSFQIHQRDRDRDRDRDHHQDQYQDHAQNRDQSSKDILPNLSLVEKHKAVSHELAEIHEMLDGAEDCKWIYEALLQFSILVNDLSSLSSSSSSSSSSKSLRPSTSLPIERTSTTHDGEVVTTTPAPVGLSTSASASDSYPASTLTLTSEPAPPTGSSNSASATNSSSTLTLASTLASTPASTSTLTSTPASALISASDPASDPALTSTSALTPATTPKVAGEAIKDRTTKGDEDDEEKKKRVYQRWLGEIQKLDPFRAGRWKDFERRLGLDL